MQKNILTLIESANDTSDLQHIKSQIQSFLSEQPSDFEYFTNLNGTYQSLLFASDTIKIISKREEFDSFISVLPPNKRAFFTTNERNWIAEHYKIHLKNLVHEFDRLNDESSMDISNKGSFTYKGHFSRMSQVLPEIISCGLQNLTSVNIYTTHSFIFDVDYSITNAYGTHTPDLVIISPKVIVSQEISVDLSCANVPGYPNGRVRAHDGHRFDADGSDGEPGLPGYNGGSLYILAESIVNNDKLKFISRGGKGGPGQNGAYRT